MILPDVNVLVYALRAGSPRHDEYAAWLSALVTGADELALHDVALSGVIRVSTNPRIMQRPSSPTAALDFVNWLRNAPRAHWIPSSAATWDVFGQLVAADPGIRGNVVPDAHLAAVALAHGARLATADRGFARFPGLRFFDPAAA